MEAWGEDYTGDTKEEGENDVGRNPSSSSSVRTAQQSMLSHALQIPSRGNPHRNVKPHPTVVYEDLLACSPESGTPYISNVHKEHQLSTPPMSSIHSEHDPGVLPLHSDFTIPTSNSKALCDDNVPHDLGAPPLEISPPRRTILGTKVQKRYKCHPEPAPSTQYPTSSRKAPPPPENLPCESLEVSHDATPPASPFQLQYVEPNALPSISPLTPGFRARKHHYAPGPNSKTQKLHETIHAQSLLLGLAFAVVWSPNNCMAPNLTQMSEFFGMDEHARDLYLGSYCALALGVFSLPISALLGFLADVCSRKYLFVCCVLGGALASAWTGSSQSFQSLFWARLLSGGCMSASVPVAFSLLGDLFSTEERNAASSGLTAMMGMGIILGQVYAGYVGPTKGWQHPFFVSATLSLGTALMVLLCVREPARGAKEKVLQDMLQSGGKYNRQLTPEAFWHAIRHNASNSILLWQGFFTSLPWGIAFVFLNDYLSQEKGFSVPDATFMVMLFGVGCAIGGICGGYVGQVCVRYNRSYLPLFMALTTFLGSVPFLLLLNSDFPNTHGYKAMAYALLGGCIASLPSVNNRPCIINVNPPETRGAALTASNLLITLGRGIGPSCITLMGSVLHESRQFSSNFTLTLFWTISAIQLLFLAKTLPEDQDAMEAELARWAAEQQKLHEEGGPKARAFDGNAHGIEAIMTASPGGRGGQPTSLLEDGGESLVSIEEYMTSFDGLAAQRSIQFMRQGFKELTDEISYLGRNCSTTELSDDDANSVGEDVMSEEELEKRRKLWKRQQERVSSQQRREAGSGIAHEETPLLG